MRANRPGRYARRPIWRIGLAGHFSSFLISKTSLYNYWGMQSMRLQPKTSCKWSYTYLLRNDLANIFNIVHNRALRSYRRLSIRSSFMPTCPAHTSAYQRLPSYPRLSLIYTNSSSFPINQHYGVVWSPVAGLRVRYDDNLWKGGIRGWWHYVQPGGLWGLWQSGQGKRFQTISLTRSALWSDWLMKEIISFSPSASAISISGRRLQPSVSTITCVGLQQSFLLLLLPLLWLTLARTWNNW